MSRCSSGGVAIFWPDPKVAVMVENGSSLRGISPETARDVLAQSMGTWTSVPCANGQPSIGVASVEVLVNDADGGAVGASGGRSPSHGGDFTSALRFIDTGWSHDPTAIALTTVRYGVQSGKIQAADIEANSETFDLTTVDLDGQFDLQSVLTHESG